MSLRQSLYRQRSELESQRTQYRSRAVDAMSIEQMNAFHAGKLKTKSKKILRWLDLADYTQKELREVRARVDVLNSLDLLEGGRLWASGEPRGQLRLVVAS